MRTDHLIDILAQGAEPVPPRTAARLTARALALGLPLSAGIVALDYGLRDDLAQVADWPMFWLKLLFPLLIALAGFLAIERLGRPGKRLGLLGLAFVLPVGALWLLAWAALDVMPPSEREAMLFGQTWRSCMFSIAYIALPVFVTAMLALRSLAPTAPMRAGAAAGAMASGAAAAVYALHCPELEAPFIAVWYVAGIALTCAVGAVVGRLVLRW